MAPLKKLFTEMAPFLKLFTEMALVLKLFAEMAPFLKTNYKNGTTTHRRTLLSLDGDNQKFGTSSHAPSLT